MLEGILLAYHAVKQIMIVQPPPPPEFDERSSFINHEVRKFTDN